MDTIKNKVDVTQSKLLSSPIMTKVPLFRNFCKFTKKKKTEKKKKTWCGYCCMPGNHMCISFPS